MRRGCASGWTAPRRPARERWHALWLALQGWSTARVATALGRDPHTVGRGLAALRRDGPAALAFAHTGGSPPPSDHDDAMHLSGSAAPGLAFTDECENCTRHREMYL